MTVKVFDTFTGTNGTDISVHTPNTDVVGGGWLDTGVNTVELDGAGSLKFSAVNGSCWIDVGSSDQIVTTTYNAGGTDNRIGVRVRSDNTLATTGTYYYFNFRPDTASGTYEIFKRISGVLTSIGSFGESLSTSTDYEITCEAIGASLKFYRGGVLKLSITDAAITTGDYAGLLHARYTNANARFRDFEVDDNTSAGITLTANYYNNLMAGN